jgi:hypothetical protein
MSQEVPVQKSYKPQMLREGSLVSLLELTESVAARLNKATDFVRTQLRGGKQELITVR